LQALISRLRRAGLAVEAAPNGYRLAIDPDCVDAHRFAELAADPATAAEALTLWRGPLDFPEGARADAVRLERQRRDARLNRVRAEVALGRGAAVLPELEELAAAHPLDEPAAALLMRALLAGGSPGRALAVFERIRGDLAETLGADPSAELAELHLEALRGPAEALRGNLPAEVSSFVGREADVRAVRELIGAHRLVTLTGPGGSGKTRLSVEAGPGVRLRHGVWRVELAPVTDPAEVPVAILTAMNRRSQLQLGRVGEADPLTRLADAVAGKDLLLILDNCEHLIGAAARVADTLLRAAPGLRLLATSREPLGIPGERIYPVEPLALPPAGADAGVASGYPAVRLLLDRAAGFTLDAGSADPVVRIVRALDGMPLAIELAAARLRTLPAKVLADRLADRFRLLTGGSRTALPRHQTLRAVVDWSWDLLSEPERALWRRFALFHGGAEVQAVERVCGADIDRLGALVDKSLLVLSDGGRYRMLETIREYGLERLAEAGERDSTRQALAAYLLDLATRAEPHLLGADQLVWLGRLSEEHDNFQASVRAAIEARDAATAVALTARLSWYWWLRGHRTEGSAIATDALALPGDSDPADRALAFMFRAINGLEGSAAIEVVTASFREAQRLSPGHEDRHPALRLLKPLATIYDAEGEPEGFAAAMALFDDPDPWLRAVSRMIIGQLRLNFGHSADRAMAEMREALDLFRQVGDRWGTGFTLSALADMAAAAGDFAVAVTWQWEALALVRELGLREDIPQMETKLAHQMWLAGDRDGARRMLKQARASAEDVGLSEVMASVEYGYATVARYEGDLEDAAARMARTVTVLDRSSWAPQFLAMARSTQGLIAAAQGRLAESREFHAEALRIAVGAKDSPVVAINLVGVADLAIKEGDPAKAAMLLGAADAVRGSIDRTVPDLDRITDEARTALGDAGFDQAYATGSGVTVPTALSAAGFTPAA
jgi:predicted ATPase